MLKFYNTAYTISAPTPTNYRLVPPEGSQATSLERRSLWLKLFIYIFLALWTIPSRAATYYIDHGGGSDTNDGLSQQHPWKAHPYMACRSGGLYSHQAGDQFIFKGGIIWPSNCFAMSIQASGTPGHEDYYGVDQTWFTGASWSRPIFDAGYYKPLSVIQTVIYINAKSSITIDNLEVRNLLNTVNQQQGLILTYKASNIFITNSWLHGWKLDTGISTDDAHGGVIALASSQITVDHSEISDAEFPDNGDCAYGPIVQFSELHDCPTALLGGSIMHDSTIYNINYPVSNFDPTAHTNVAYVLKASQLYNNIVYNTHAGVNFFIEPCWGGSDSTAYVYNNVIIGNTSSNSLIATRAEQGGVGASCGTVYILNNTLVVTRGMLAIIAGPNPPEYAHIKTLVIQNNQYIADYSRSPSCYDDLRFSCDKVGTATDTNNVTISSASASSEGYTMSELYAPKTGSNPIMAGGMNLSMLTTQMSQLSQDIKGSSRPLVGPWDVGAYQLTQPGSPTYPVKPAPPTNLKVAVW